MRSSVSLFINTILIMFYLLLTVNSDSFYYKRTLSCLQNNSVTCTQWQEGTSLSYYSSYRYYYCFSERTYVLTSQGPKAMKDLIVGDEVFGIDP
jgi:hypothetical protein